MSLFLIITDQFQNHKFSILETFESDFRMHHRSRQNWFINLFLKALHGLTPGYISELLIPCSTSWPLRSGDQSLLSIPRTQLKNKSDRAFSVVGTKLWNRQLTITPSPCIDIFKTHLKTHHLSLAAKLPWKHAWPHSRHFKTLYSFINLLISSYLLLCLLLGHSCVLQSNNATIESLCEALWSAFVLF